MTRNRTLLLALAVVSIGAIMVACGGGSDSGKDYTAGPLLCGGLGTISYNYTGHMTEEVLPLSGSPAPGSSEQPHTPLKVVWDVQGNVEKGSSLSDYSLHLIMNNSVGTATGKTESIVLHDGSGYFNIGLGWQAAGNRPPDQLHRPSTICSSLSPDLDTTKLGIPTSEDVNGVPSYKFTFQDVPTEFLSRDADFGASSDAAQNIHSVSGSIWVAKKGDQVTKVDITGAGAYPNGQSITVTMQYELTDVGSDIKVAAPI
jgi:hypothetical protein